jgi:hypothetical protein
MAWLTAALGRASPMPSIEKLLDHKPPQASLEEIEQQRAFEDKVKRAFITTEQRRGPLKRRPARIPSSA